MRVVCIGCTTELTYAEGACSIGRMDDLVVFARMTPEEQERKLAEVAPPARSGDDAPKAPMAKGLFGGAPKAYEHTAHAFGYLALGAREPRLYDVASAGSVAADASLKNARVTIRLDRLRIAAYPGGGVHRVLFEFDAENHRPSGKDEIHFAMTYRAQEGESAAIVGYPIFVGLGVGTAGVSFRCHTINVKNEDDESFLAALESDGVNQGLELLEVGQPAIKPLSRLALGMAKAIARRHRNVAVQDFYLGLDFSGSSTGARLRQGTYFAVQAPEEVLSDCWSKWKYNAASGQLVKSSDGKAIGYNYVAFSLTKYEGA